MSNYTGAECPVCSKHFAAQDDIVVCPACGAPHHRACYMQQGHCAFEQNHGTGKTWKSPAENTEQAVPPEQAAAGRADGVAGEETAAKYCGQCGAKNPEGGIFCTRCGVRFGYEPTSADSAPQNRHGGTRHNPYANPYGMYTASAPESYGGVAANTAIAGVSAHDLALYIGPSAGHYISTFQKVEETNSNFSFNASAMAFGPFYYFYRRMYSLGLIMLALFFVSSIPRFLYSAEVFPLAVEQYGLTEFFAQRGLEFDAVDTVAAAHYSQLSTYAQMAYVFAQVMVSLIANRFYMDRAVRTVKERWQQIPDYQGHGRQEYEIALVQSGGVRTSMVMLVMMVVYFGTSIIVSRLVL